MALGPQDREVYAALAYGFAVDRAAATLPQTTAAPIFTVTGGRVAIAGLVGEVTTAIQNQANNAKITSNPTVGTDVDLCSVLNIQAKELGTLLGITGIFSDALVGANAGATVLPQRAVVVPPGTIDLSCAASNSGAVKWRIYYFPLDIGAEVVAA